MNLGDKASIEQILKEKLLPTIGTASRFSGRYETRFYDRQVTVSPPRASCRAGSLAGVETEVEGMRTASEGFTVFENSPVPALERHVISVSDSDGKKS